MKPGLFTILNPLCQWEFSTLLYYVWLSQCINHWLSTGLPSFLGSLHVSFASYTVWSWAKVPLAMSKLASVCWINSRAKTWFPPHNEEYQIKMGEHGWTFLKMIYSFLSRKSPDCTQDCRKPNDKRFVDLERDHLFWGLGRYYEHNDKHGYGGYGLDEILSKYMPSNISSINPSKSCSLTAI